jgi:membrane protein YqaA with SNARE-associated domain
MYGDVWSSWAIALAAILTVLGGIIKWSVGAFAKRDVAIYAMEIALEGQKGKIHLLSNSVMSSEQRMMISLDGVRSDISGVTVRLDRLLEAMMVDRQGSK